MTEIRFASLAQFRTEHEFYRDGNGVLRRSGADISIRPTTETERSLQRHGILFKRTAAGFVLLYEVANPAAEDDTPLRPITGRLSWDFVLQLDDAQLPNYSSLPLRPAPDQFYHISNRHPHAGAASDPVKVTSGTFLSQDELLTLRPPRFSLLLDTPAPAPFVTLRNTWDEIVLAQRVQAVEQQKWLHVDLQGRAAERYTMAVEGVAETTEFFVAPEVLGPPPFAMLTLYAGSGIAAANRVVDESGTPEPKQFLLRIARRETVWRYYVALKFRTDADPGELSITSADPAFTFTARAPVSKLGLETVIPFDSDSVLLPYRSEPIRGVTLEKATTVTPGALKIEDLPNPAPDTLKEDKDSGTLYSDAFIYI